MTAVERIAAWRTSDGQVFTFESSAVDHQDRLDRAELATKALRDGASVGVALRDHGFMHSSQPLHELDDMFTTSELIISYWQCRDTPGYQPYAILPDGSVMVGGDAGSWSGGYSSPVHPRDLVRYWVDTKAQLAKYPGLIAQRDRDIAWRKERRP